MNNNPDNRREPPVRKRGLNIGLILLLIATVAAVIILINRIRSSRNASEFGFENIVQTIEEGKTTYNGIETSVVLKSIAAEVQSSNNSTGVFEVYGEVVINGKTYSFSFYCDEKQYDAIVIAIDNANVDGIKYEMPLTPVRSNAWLNILINIVPIIILGGISIWLFKSLLANNSNQQAFNFGKSRARMAKDKNTTFKDVAGCDEEKVELEEVIDFLKNPKKYQEIGARIPKGMLLVGPPGTGKTLLAKAVAGEANVPFFSISGSDFVEMFVGVGASRVRDLFKDAKEHAPCIVFIDEIDAVGRQRGAGMGGGHDEREQTLNQLLVEMDGFGPNSGVIVMAATNRPDVLDPALLRPGRFDRQITISSPDVTGREAILKVHARNKHFDVDVHFDQIAQRIPGFSGADIENLLNEAALLAARANRKIITTADIDEAMDRVMMGPAKKTRKISDEEKRLVAYHEAGHAVIGIKLERASIVQKVTIIPRGQFGGYNLMMPEKEKFIQTKSDLLESITGYLGGRVSEEIVFNEISTGAHNDFENATKIARAMVAEYGMSDLGPIQYEQNTGSVFLGRDYLKDKNFSEQIAHEIDIEIRKIIESCYAKCKQVLLENRDLLDRIATYLIKLETLTKEDIDEIYKTGYLKRADEVKEAPTPINPLDNQTEENTDSTNEN